MESTRVTITTPDGDMPAHLWLPESGSGPGILLLQEIFGVSRYIEQRARDLASLGYVVLAPELFWRLGVSSVEEGPDALEQALALLQRADWQAAVRDSLDALEQIRSRSEVVGGVGIVGFCFGGGLGFSVAAESSPDVLVSYYGSALPDILGLVDPDAPVTVVEPEAVTAPSLHHFGLADQFLTPVVVEQVRDALEPLEHVTFHAYATADHAFDNPDFFLHDADASRLAWERTAAWLAENLPVGGASAPAQ
ncbi:dienelactone hydrolase family protein [Nocardioides sp. Soil805]|uniref:dienelactone hydrolase family protein n=1 Tax=Nocardioides sp. Soil805 TaxID=1736416 RepID=UPI0007034CFD|nr:dienelactone hydrolase family protein [Nocardioides sp. Soil805]KRF30652.1 carboxymethylenebutenolidase [Nocardioides sp. Soil805]